MSRAAGAHPLRSPVGIFESLLVAGVPLAIIYGVVGGSAGGFVSAAELPLAALIWLATWPMRRSRRNAQAARQGALQRAAEQGRPVRPEDYEDRQL